MNNKYHDIEYQGVKIMCLAYYIDKLEYTAKRYIYIVDMDIPVDTYIGNGRIFHEPAVNKPGYGNPVFKTLKEAKTFVDLYEGFKQ